ncbi:MAG: hypothetical protein N2691_00915 [Patescibacteria group bacterium]|nr:hypothetical protein [Patescibacteria group bacterium]
MTFSTVMPVHRSTISALFSYPLYPGEGLSIWGIIRKQTTGYQTHLDIWYLVHMEEMVPFTFQKSEFYDAGWMPYDKAVLRIKTAAFKPVVEKIRRLW